METSIRYVRIGDQDLGESSQIKPALCFRGRKVAHAVINDETRVRVVSVPLIDHDHSAPVLFKRNDYPLQMFIDGIEKIGRRKGMTQRARYFLDRAQSGGVEDDAQLPPDEDAPAQVEARPDDDPLGMSATLRAIAASGKPGKPASGAIRKPGGTLIARLAAEYGLEPPKLRKLLRSKGMRAPYENEKAIRKAIGK